MSVNYVFVGPHRALLRKLRERLEEFAQGRGRYYPGFGLDDRQVVLVDEAIKVLGELLDEKLPEGMSKA